MPPTDIKVLHILQNFGVGGMESRVARLAFGLQGKGFSTTVATLRQRPGRRQELPEGVDLESFEIPSGLHIGEIFRLAAFIRRGGYHMVHTHNWSTMFYGILAARLARTTLALHEEHGLNYEDLGRTSWKRLWAQRMLARLSHHILAVNAPIGRHMQSHWKVPARRITVIPNGVDTSRFAPAAEAPAGVFTIGTVCRLDKVKNLPGLIKGYARFRADAPEGQTRLVIVGEGPLRAELDALIETLELSGSVEFPGDVKDAENWYRRFHVFVNSSFFEGMSNTILEAMACGLPIVASDVDGNRCWLEENANALLYPSDDENALGARFGELFRSRESGRRMGGINRARIEKEFDNRGFLEVYRAAYLDIAKRLGRA